MSIESIGNNPLSNTTSTSLSNIASKSIPSYLEVWRRNPSWPVHTANSGDNKIVGLYAIYPPNSGNFISVVCSGDYTVDYGDGTVTNYSAGVTGYYNYDYTTSYSGIDYSDIPVILTDGPCFVTKLQESNGTYNHGYNNGDEVILYNLSGISPNEVKTNYPYYVTNATDTTFEISVEKSGSPLSWSTVGYANLLPYKVAKVTITPQAGQVLSSGNFFVKHNEPGLVNRHRTGWLEMIVASSGLSSLTISGSITTTVQHSVLENVEIKEISNSLTSFANLLHSCFNLKNFALDCSNGITDMSSLFSGCTNLIALRLADTRSVTNMILMFNGCRNLVTIPFIDTGNVTNMTSMFNSCVNLITIPSIDTSKATVVSTMFQGCRSLVNLPILDFNGVISSAANTFAGCASLKKIHIKNMSGNFLGITFFGISSGSTQTVTWSLSSIILENLKNGLPSTSFYMANLPSLEEVTITGLNISSSSTSLFNNCSTLKKVIIVGNRLSTTYSSLFNNCSSLKSISIPNTSGISLMNSMFAFCTSLTEAPFLETETVTNVTSMFNGCTSLVSIPNYNFSSVTSGSFAGIFNNCPSLSRIQASGMRFSFSVADCMLGSSALNELYSNLAVVSGQILTVTGNYGTASDDITIATDKGWSVTG